MIGCGSFAELCHGPAQKAAVASQPGNRLAGCCDSDPAAALRYRRLFGYERDYRDPRVMLGEERPSAVILAVPPQAMCAAAGSVLEMGIPVLLEKPPGMTPQELESLISSAEKAGTGAQVGFNRHYMPVMRAAQGILSGSFPAGEATRITYEMARQERWDADFSTTAIHALDASLLLARSPFRAATIAYEPQRRDGKEAMDVTVSAQCRTNTQVTVRIRPVSSRNSDSATVEAGRESLVLSIPISPQSEGDGAVEHRRGGVLVSAYSDRGVGAVERMGVLAETEAFFHSVRAGGPFSPALQDCRQQVALMDAIRNRRPGPFGFAPG
jgi:predicted dehydrogenase